MKHYSLLILVHFRLYMLMLKGKCVFNISVWRETRHLKMLRAQIQEEKGGKTGGE